MTDVHSRPDWLVPGAEVVVFTIGGKGVGLGVPDAKATTITTIAAQSFCIVGSTDRFKIRTQEHYQRGDGGWSGHFGGTRRVVPLDSDEGRRELDKFRRMRLERSAHVTCETWIRKRNVENRLAAIAALQAVDDE